MSESIEYTFGRIKAALRGVGDFRSETLHDYLKGVAVMAEALADEVRQLREENENLRIEYTQLCDMYEKDLDKKVDSAPRGAKGDHNGEVSRRARGGNSPAS